MLWLRMFYSVGFRLVKFVLLSLIINFLLGFEIISLDTDSDSDSENEVKGGKAKEDNKDLIGVLVTKDDGKLSMSKSEFDIHSINNANVDTKELSKNEIPRSTLGTSASMTSRLESMLTRFMALNLDGIKAEIDRRGIANTPYLDLSDADKELMDKYHSEANAVALQSQNQMVSSIQAEKDKAAFAASKSEASDANRTESTPTGVKRELPEAYPGSSSKKISLDPQGGSLTGTSETFESKSADSKASKVDSESNPK